MMLFVTLPTASAAMRRAAIQSRRKCRLLSPTKASFLFGSPGVVTTTTQCYSSTPKLLDDDDGLPYHVVVGMPALSPTMEMGTLAAWNVQQGDAFAAGDALAKIETDKATIDFEAQDDGHVAKLLVDEGTQDVAVGVPIMITVEEAEDIGAFADYEPPATTAEPVVEEEEPVVEAAAAEVPDVPATPPPPPSPSPPARAPQPVAAHAPAVAPQLPLVSTLSPMWGNMAKISSPIAKTLAAQQEEYIEKYGTTGQVPL